MNNELIEYLSGFVTDNRRELFEKVLAQRTRYMSVALEDIYQPHNASAVLRTCDCFGVQDVHIIENKNEYNINPDVALGSFQWLTMNKYNQKENNTVDTIKSLKNDGYRIVATTPHTNDVNLDEFDLSKGKAVFFFGTELMGLTDEMMDHADEYLKIPMKGFTESFNISVSAAIILHHLSHKLYNSDIDWQLSEDEKQELRLQWYRNSIKKSEMLEKRFIEEKS